VRGIVALLACAACNQVFDIKSTRAIDAGEIVIYVDAPDAPPRELRIVAPASPSNVFVDDRLVLEAAVHGPPNLTATFTATSGAGMIVPASQQVVLDGNGIAQADVMYTAPSSPAADTLTFAATAAELTAPAQDLMLDVHDLSSVGLDAAQSRTQNVNANAAVGIKIMIPSQTVVRDLGMYATAASGGNVRMALYTAGSSAPGSLVVSSNAAPVAAGRNVIPVTPTPLAAGNYWLLEVFDATTAVDWQLAGLYGTEAFSYASAWPSSWNLQFVTVANTTFAMFMRVEL
jgi:hypothetical protein